MDEPISNEGRRHSEDSKLAGPSGPLGHVDEVNGGDSLEVPEFVPTVHELLQLVEYWQTVSIDMEYLSFYTQTAGSDWNRKWLFADLRVGRIARLLGKD